MSHIVRKGEKEWIDQVLGGKKLVYSTTNFLNLPLEEALQNIADGGLRNVELWGNLKHLDPRNLEEDPRRVLEVSRALGLNIASIHAPFTITGVADKEKKIRAWEKLVARTIDNAAFLQAGLVVVHPGTADFYESEKVYLKMIERTEKSLVRLADLAAEKGIRLALENLPAHRNPRYGRKVGDLYDFAVRSGKDNLGLCFDTGHVIFNNGNVTEDFRRYADRIFEIHLNDNIWGMHIDLHLVPGTGSVDWKRFRKALTTVPFDGLITLELDSRGRPKNIFSEAREFIREYFFPTPKENRSGSGKPGSRERKK